MNSYQLTFITPLFSKGIYDDRPEIRPSAIRGQLHGWFRALGGTYADEKTVFGGVHGGAMASKIVIRIAEVLGIASSQNSLPHKRGGQASPKAAYEPGTSFQLQVLDRLGGVPSRLQPAWNRTLESWLIAGSLGLRSTRGGGSFKWADAPSEANAYFATLGRLLKGAPLCFDLLDKVFATAEEARKVAAETIAHQALRDVSYPLGAVRQGRTDPAPSRKTSTLRLTIRQFADGYRILALWDERQSVTGNTRDHLRTAIDRLARGTAHSAPTEIGRLLAESSLG